MFHGRTFLSWLSDSISSFYTIPNTMHSFMGLHTSQALPVASCAGENLRTGAGGGFFNPFGICDQLAAMSRQLI